MNKLRFVPAMFFLLAISWYGLFADSLSDSLSDRGTALAADRKAKDIKVVLYMTDW